MPLYRIERHVGEKTAEEIDAGAFRALTCSAQFSGLTWLHSYYDPRARYFTCYYEAQNPEQIREHAEAAHIPCDSITEVVEYLPEMYR